jgi:hypothetical protein
VVAAAPPPIAIVQRVVARPRSLTFAVDRQPQTVRVAWVPAAKLHDCASDRAYRLPGRAVAVVHLMPARSARRMGPFATAVKICDFESDVAWAVGLPKRLPYAVHRAGRTLTITFG